MSLADTVNNMLAERGRMHTIKRSVVTAGDNKWSAGGVASIVYIPVMARRRYYKPHEVRGLIRERDIKIIVGSGRDTLPIQGDLIVKGEYTAANDSITVPWALVINVVENDDGDDFSSAHIQARV